MECPELGGEGEARVEEVMEVERKPRPPPSLAREEGGASSATLTRLSISSARSSVFSFSSWISLHTATRLSLA